MSEYVIEMINITKQFFGNVANDNITLQLKKGEIHALLGENGAGKSTLMSILFGLYQKDSGYILKDGQKVEINSPNDATALHIGMVHQHFKLIDIFTALQNIALISNNSKKFDLKKIRLEVEEICQRYGFEIDLDKKVLNKKIKFKDFEDYIKTH